MADQLTTDVVVKLEDILKDKTSETNKTVETNPKAKKKKKKKRTVNSVQPPNGMRISGRFWKNSRDKSSNIIKTVGIKKANKFEKLKKLKAHMNRMKMLTKNIVDARNEEIEQKKERRRMNLKRQEENKLKSDIVQEIRNPAKIKRMKRKQLRTIEKRDTLKKK